MRQRLPELFLIPTATWWRALESLCSTPWRNWKNAKQTQKANTNLTACWPENYQVVATAAGFDQLPIEVVLQPDEKRTLDLHLKLSALLDRVVVSAAPGGELTSQIASSVSVVTAEEIDDRAAQIAVDVLRGLPGTEINQSGGRGTITSAFIRGGNSNYNLVMIDGIELNDFGGGFDLSPLPAEGVQQVEVIRGPESALYGSNAVSGVINIETIRGRRSAAFFVFGRSRQLCTPGGWRPPERD